MPSARHRCARLLAGLGLILAACGADATTPSASPTVGSSPTPSVAAPTASGPVAGDVVPAPGSDSVVYAPNPEAVVVAIDAGHGGCLDWGVPDPSERGVELSEKTLTLEIAQALRERLEAEGVTVVMVRDDDVALAGDDYPELGCEGPPWRDVNGDGEAGFDPEGATRTRDELQARLDVANLVGADAFVSIHINSPFEAGQPIEIAFTETFYTDETPWGAVATERLARGIQEGVVGHLSEVAGYERGDRGITAHNFYLVAPTLFEPTPERPDPVKQPTRNALMPTVLAEVGSITLRDEHDLLASREGQAAVADGLFEGLVGFFRDRPLAARISLAEVAPGTRPEPVPGDGPPFWPPLVTGAAEVRVTNTGTEPIPAGAALATGWATTDDPYLAAPPELVEPTVPVLPALAPGESITAIVDLSDAPPAGRGLAWISLIVGKDMLADLGSPPLQLATEAP
jgi:N-acetylmuramoyl-L-alanine amidase